MNDFASQRLTMVETQLRPNEVTDPRLLAAMGALPRDRFVPERRRVLSYMDEGIEVFPSTDDAPARLLLAPMVLARLIQLAAVEPEDAVLDVGCATGYSTGVLAALGRVVVGVEAEPELAKAARRALGDLGLNNTEIFKGPLAEGCPKQGPYEVILLNGSVPEPPQALLGQLAEGGRLAAILGQGSYGAQGKAYLFIRTGGEMSGVAHFNAGAPPLPGFSPAPAFDF
jgi:protein-L-isoaspartate(D-aspartate) O-methyltransferase